MSSTNGEDEQLGPQPEPLVETGTASAPIGLDNALAQDPDLVQQPVDLTRSVTDALDVAATSVAEMGVDVQRDVARLGEAITRASTAPLTEVFQQQNRDLPDQAASIAGTSLRDSASELLDGWRRAQEHNAERFRQTMASVRTFVGGIGSWVAKTAKAAGEKVAEYYRQAAPPNWTTDPDQAVLDYDGAVQLALDEGIPLAWVPDQTTVKLLLAVPARAVDRSARLHAILRDRTPIILDYCGERLDQIAAIPTASARQRQSVDFARQALQALRLGLTAPAQAGASSLIETLLEQAFTTIHGSYQQGKVRDRVLDVLQRTSLGLVFLGTLREAVTLVPAFKAMEPWWPNTGVAPLKTFSRHVTVHRLTAPDQVTPVNALIAVTLAVSLLSQEHDSGWRNCKMVIGFDALQATLRARQATS